MPRSEVGSVRVSIILPTLNERDNIGLLIPALRNCLSGNHDLQFIIVDDSSTDKTADYALPHLNPSIDCVIRRKSPRSLAGSILEGLRVAEFEQVLVLDTDFTHDPGDARLLLSIAPFFDVVIGSRFVPGGGMESLRHYRASATFNLLVRFLMGSQIRDHLGGFWTARKSAIVNFLTENIFTGYGDYSISLLHQLQLGKNRIIEVPTIFRSRKLGISKSKFTRMIFTYLLTAIRTCRRHGRVSRISIGSPQVQ